MAQQGIDDDTPKQSPNESDTQHEATPAHPVFPVVGLGASAGGVQALQHFFAAMPADSGMAFVVIMHLSPDRESHVAAVLQNTTTMPVTQVNETVTLEPNRVYVIPPTKHLSMRDGTIEVVEAERPQGQQVAIDVFFRTLAETHHTHAVGIVLSGTGADGSVGIKRLKETGGVAIAQEPAEAEYDGMPRNAINTGVIDWVLPVARMPEQLVALWQNAERITLPADAPVVDPSEAAEQALRDVLAAVRVRTGHDFTHYKRGTLLRRIERRMQVRTMQTLPAYRDYLREQPQEATLLLQDLLIGVTNFFRDRQAFEALEREVVPLLFEGKATDDVIRVWVAGCASGEEAYSVAMLLLEYAARLSDPPHIQVFATDIDESAIQLAREGSYPTSIEADVSAARLRRFFTREAGGYRINKQVRERVLFAVHNLIKDPPFSRCALITCRNLLIYLNRDAQEQVFDLFHFAAHREGFLFLGSSESVDGASDLFTPLDVKHRIFRAKLTGRPLRDVPVLAFEAPHGRLVPAQRNEERRRIAFGELHQRMLEHYAPPSLVVNADYEIVHLSDHAGRFIQFGGGEPSLNLLTVIVPQLRAELRTALVQAFQSGRTTEARRVQIERDGHTRYVNMIVRPQHDLVTDATYALVLFAEADQIIGTEGTAAEGDAGEPVVSHLESEIQQLRAQLQTSSERYETSLEELKASNEELQVINEEFRSATEELETSKEELQSVNEELRTVNQALNATVDEVSAANDDLSNLVSSTDIATVFLDRALHVKRYTPPAQGIFNLMPLDEGRPLSDITNTLDYADMLEDASSVLRTLQPVERETNSRDGRWFLARVVPYRTLNDYIDGVVLTFVDITERKRAEDTVRENAERQAFLLTLSDALRTLSDPIDIQATASRVLGEHLGTDRAYYVDIDEATQEYVVDRDWHQPGAPSHARRYPLAAWQMPWLLDGTTWVVRDVDWDPALPDEQRASYRGNDIGAAIVVPLLKDRRLVATLVTNQHAPRDWTAQEIALVEETAERTWAAVQRARGEAATARAERRAEGLIERMGDAHCVLDRDFHIERVNAATERVLGVPRTALVGRSHWDVFPASVDAPIGRAFRRVVQEGVEQHLAHHYTGEGYDMHIEVDAYPTDEGGVAMFWRDVTERVRAESALRASEEKYRALFNEMDEAYAVVEVIADAEGRWTDFLFLEVNPAFMRHTGMPHPVGRTATQLLGTPNPRWAELYGRAVQTGTSIRLEEAEFTLGRVFDLNIFRLGGEGSRRVAVLFTDITERKRAEDSARENAERQAFLLRFSDTLRVEPDADAVVSRALQMLFVQMRLDRCYVAVYRLADDRADITHQVGNDRVPPLPDGIRLSDFPDAFQVVFDTTLVIDDVAETNGLTDVDRGNMDALGMGALVAATLRKGVNAPLWVIVAVSATPRHWTQGEVALIEEVTERTWAAVERARAEAALRASEERARTLVKNLPGAAAFIFDRDLRYVLADGEALYAVGNTPADFEGKMVQEANSPTALAFLEPPLRRALGGETFESENTEGGIAFLSRGVPLRGDNGDVTGVLVVSYNITERKEAEAALERAYAAEQLARNEAEAALHVRDQFLAVASHELRTPLTSLLGYTNMLAMPTVHDPATISRMTERISRQALRLNALIEQLLDVSRLQRGQFALESEAVDVGALVARVVDETRATLPPTAKHRIELALPDEPVVIAGDAQRLEQVVQNLLSNAVKYSPEGGLIRVAARTYNGEAVIEVADQGIGIALDAQARMFEPFYRAPNVGPQSSGFGLGLYIIREIVQRHSGRIEVESAEEEGSTFRVLLPLEAAS
jgi:PAS domain S-box-containing protein